MRHIEWDQEAIPMDIEIATLLKTAFPALEMVNLYPTEPDETAIAEALSKYGFNIE